MGNLFAKQKTPEDINLVRKARIEFQDYLTRVQTSTLTSVNSKQLTPESGQRILAKLKDGFEWLEKNPNATYGEIFAKYDAISVEVKRLLRVDKPKNEFRSRLVALPVIMDDLVTKKKITEEQSTKVMELVSQEESWFSKNEATATEIDFSQEKLKIDDTLVKIIPDQQTRNYIQSETDRYKNVPPSQLVSIIDQKEAEIEQIKSQTIDVKEGVNIALSTAGKVFFGFLIVVVCLFSGSLAANMAIGRPPIYRIMYFIYGAFPLFVPFVFIYAIIMRIKNGALPTYALLPISIEPAVTSLGKLLWAPFYWIPDHRSVEAYDLFQSKLQGSA
jgi:hypothetical protein